MIGIFYSGCLIKLPIYTWLMPPFSFLYQKILHPIINQLAVQLLVIILKVYIQIYLNFNYLCEILFPDFNPYIRFVLLCFFEMVLLLSSDIATQPARLTSILLLL